MSLTRTPIRTVYICTRWLVLLCCTAALQFASTKTLANQATLSIAPSEFANLLPQAELTGQGKLTFFGLEVYESSLWTTPNFKALHFAAYHFALELHYLRHFSAADIAKRSLEEMQKIEPVPEQKAALWLKTLNDALPNVKKGDRVVGVHQPGVGVTFWHNGKRYGEIRDVDFSRQFFAIWLSPKTSTPKLRLALLGQSGK